MSPGSCILPACMSVSVLCGSTLGLVLYKVLTLWGNSALDFLRHRLEGAGGGGNKSNYYRGGFGGSHQFSPA